MAADDRHAGEMEQPRHRPVLDAGPADEAHHPRAVRDMVERGELAVVGAVVEPMLTVVPAVRTSEEGEAGDAERAREAAAAPLPGSGSRSGRSRTDRARAACRHRPSRTRSAAAARRRSSRNRAEAARLRERSCRSADQAQASSSDDDAERGDVEQLPAVAQRHDAASRPCASQLNQSRGLPGGIAAPAAASAPTGGASDRQCMAGVNRPTGR